jgi:hypothetical protein
MTRIRTDAEIGHWVCAMTHGKYAPETSSCIGFERDGKIVAGTMFENFNGRSMVAHMAIDGRASREFYQYVAKYVFEECGVYKLIGPVPSDNLKAIHLDKKMGFIEECRIENAAPNGDIVILTLTKHNCRFLKGNYVEAKSAAIA